MKTSSVSATGAAAETVVTPMQSADVAVFRRRSSVRYVIISLNSVLYSDQIFTGFGK